ncbi:unnamed protein product, partial [Symbiodinium sp. KB8]
MAGGKSRKKKWAKGKANFALGLHRAGFAELSVVFACVDRNACGAGGLQLGSSLMPAFKIRATITRLGFRVWSPQFPEHNFGGRCLYMKKPTTSIFPAAVVEQVKEKLANLVMFDK